MREAVEDEEEYRDGCILREEEDSLAAQEKDEVRMGMSMSEELLELNREQSKSLDEIMQRYYASIPNDAGNMGEKEGVPTTGNVNERADEAYTSEEEPLVDDERTLEEEEKQENWGRDVVEEVAALHSDANLSIKQIMQMYYPDDAAKGDRK